MKSDDDEVNCQTTIDQQITPRQQDRYLTLNSESKTPQQSRRRDIHETHHSSCLTAAPSPPQSTSNKEVPKPIRSSLPFIFTQHLLHADEHTQRAHTCIPTPVTSATLRRAHTCILHSYTVASASWLQPCECFRTHVVFTPRCSKRHQRSVGLVGAASTASNRPRRKRRWITSGESPWPALNSTHENARANRTTTRSYHQTSTRAALCLSTTRQHLPPLRRRKRMHWRRCTAAAMVIPTK